MTNSSQPADEYEKVGEFVHIFLRPGSKVYQAYYRRDGVTVRQSLKTQSRKQARVLALKLERKVETGGPVPTQPPLLVDVIAEYLAHLQGLGRAAKTIGKYRHCFKLVQQLAAERQLKRIDGLDHRFVDAFRNRRAEEGQPLTVLYDLVIIRQLVNFALRRKLLDEDPLEGLKLVKPPATPQPAWTKEQVDLIVAAILPRYRPYFLFLAETGARSGEAIWLTWDDIDFDNGVVHIRAKPEWRPKSGDQRVVPMSPALREMLSSERRDGHWVFTAAASAKRPVSGRQVDGRRALSHLKTVLKRLGLPGHQHTFRHSFISRALTSGTPEAIVRAWVGHVDHRIIRTYTHIADTISQDAMQRLNREGGEGLAAG